ncbi:succinate-semialdehyde dehydrogenase/glutarate-semialdehyde dehydrogenase [Actinomadura luteofluorescens]|uniref:Succinate-semialdehyde dehydrogenase/glutarate-semialdehyde dehydrogenase n=1 Tax=Actinomadura luteofluorescens TaxID=46163 RepID=A0A7Y9JII8_9ACTN|nr:aldehyde dehydrogenase family protein [Actinomadura luteofluorescens]NYD49703.1 succinate-semialdehyde dehydrogenase/glutarate-semialdehyde dehydrogenase [Actinomadura luteofluorescens]
MPDEVALRIGGRARAAHGEAVYDAVSPATGERIASVARAAESDVDAAVAAAAEAFEAHRQESAFTRADRCHRIAALVEERAATMARLLSLEHGKPVDQAEAEIRLAADGFRLAAEEAKRLGGETVPARDGAKLVLTTRKPRGVFAVMTPFNFPVNIPVEYLGPLLACGNAVVWRPAPSMAAVAGALYDCIEDAGVPPGLVNLITGPDLGPARRLVSHPAVNGVGFTGSSKAGAEIARLAAGKAQVMELGGNGPIVVLPDADLDRAAPAIASAAFANSGQSCSAAGRVIAAESVAAELEERLVEEARREVVGSPFEAGTTMGPVHTRGVADAMARHVADALARGGRTAFGGAPLPDRPTDLFWRPTVLVGLDADAAALGEETFGPLAPVLRVAGDTEAILAAANRGRYGLSSAVFGRDLDRTLAVAGRLRAGQVTVNDTSNYWELHLPFGGAPGTDSGHGRLGGRYIAEAVTEIQSISVDLTPPWR